MYKKKKSVGSGSSEAVFIGLGSPQIPQTSKQSVVPEPPPPTVTPLKPVYTRIIETLNFPPSAVPVTSNFFTLTFDARLKWYHFQHVIRANSAGGTCFASVNARRTSYTGERIWAPTITLREDLGLENVHDQIWGFCDFILPAGTYFSLEVTGGDPVFTKIELVFEPLV